MLHPAQVLCLTAYTLCGNHTWCKPGPLRNQLTVSAPNLTSGTERNQEKNSQSNVCNLPQPPKITLSHWLFLGLRSWSYVWCWNCLITPSCWIASTVATPCTLPANLGENAFSVCTRQISMIWILFLCRQDKSLIRIFELSRDRCSEQRRAHTAVQNIRYRNFLE